MRGAGGSPGGTGTFILGVLMAMAGAYLLLHSITVTHSFGLGHVLYRVPLGVSGLGVTAGALLVPLMAGIGLVFYDAKSIWGWLVGGGALAAMVLGVLMSLRFSLRTMSLLELIAILVLFLGGIGLFARSLKANPKP